MTDVPGDDALDGCELDFADEDTTPDEDLPTPDEED